MCWTCQPFSAQTQLLPSDQVDTPFTKRNLMSGNLQQSRALTWSDCAFIQCLIRRYLDLVTRLSQHLLSGYGHYCCWVWPPWRLHLSLMSI
jgi:hypothetical protein